MTSPAARTLAHCRKIGGLAADVSKWNPHSKRSFDLFGFGDIIWVQTNGDTTLIQVTSGSNLATRIHKIMREKNLEALQWLLGEGNRIEVWGWRKLKGRGRRKWWAKRAAIKLSPQMRLEAEDLEDA